MMTKFNKSQVDALDEKFRIRLFAHSFTYSFNKYLNNYVSAPAKYLDERRRRIDTVPS